MARAKSRLRRVLNARYLRWRALGGLTAALPPLGRWLGFFPRHVGLVEGADRVLADEVRPVPAAELAPDLDFLRRCLPHDSTAPGLTLPDGVVTGRRTAIYRRPWIDVSTGSILLPRRGRTVLMRGEVANWNATSARAWRTRHPVPGRAFSALPANNYFHLLLENGVRLVDLLDSGAVADAPLTVVKEADGGAAEAALYRALAALYPEMTIRHLPAGALAEPDEAVAHFPPDNHWEWPPVTRAQTERLAAGFDAVYGAAASADGPELLFLSRGDAKLRRLRNAAALERALAGRGFVPLVATDANHPQQIARFRAARTVVAVHGAGLTNLLFCAPGTRVVEIFPANFVKSPYWHLCRRLGLAHRAVVGGPGDYDQTFEADVDAVLSALKGG